MKGSTNRKPPVSVLERPSRIAIGESGTSANRNRATPAANRYLSRYSKAPLSTAAGFNSLWAPQIHQESAAGATHNAKPKPSGQKSLVNSSETRHM